MAGQLNRTRTGWLNETADSLESWADEIENFDVPERGVCEDCEGSGSITCDACEGDGEIEAEDGIMVTCETCNGGDNPTDCETCDGTGETSLEDWLQTVMDEVTIVDESPV